jgi:hypothetical protein
LPEPGIKPEGAFTLCEEMVKSCAKDEARRFPLGGLMLSNGAAQVEKNDMKNMLKFGR